MRSNIPKLQDYKNGIDFVNYGCASTRQKIEIERLTTELERSQVTVCTGLERRSGQDRRQNQLSALKWLFFKGLRESTRRAEDRNCIVVFDRYKPSLLLGIIIVLSLSLLDALLTLILISQGAKELNPVMRYYLNHGTFTFIFVKYGLTALPMFIILFAKDALDTRYRINSGILFYVFAGFFSCVVIWEAHLLTIIAS